jgi:hypothetical protein
MQSLQHGQQLGIRQQLGVQQEAQPQHGQHHGIQIMKY